MRIVLIQTRQNALYQFDKPDLSYSRREAAEGQREMIAQNLRLMREAPVCDLMVTTEAVNFAGPPDRVNADDTALIGETFPDLTAAFSEIAREKDCYVAAGLYCREADIPRGIPGSPESVGSGLCNTLWLFERTGGIAGVRTPSQVISPEGRILAEGSRTEAEAVLCEMPDPGTCRKLREMRLREQAAKIRKNKGTRSVT